MDKTSSLPIKALVTGGGGFLGYKIILQLIKQGYQVTSFSRSKNYPQLKDLGIKHIAGDIRNREDVDKACQNQDIIFHVASIAGINGSYKLYYDINYLGSENIIKSALKNKVKKIIYTSSPSVAYSVDAVEGEDETIGYPQTYLSHYSKTKALAEKLILQQDQTKILTCAIRPHLIWGENDNHLIPILINGAREKSIRQIGNGKNLVDITYVDNAAHAHILVEKALMKNSKVCGQAYFIGDEKPVNLWQWINKLLKELNEPQITKKISFTFAYMVGFLFELSHKLFSYPKELSLSRFVVFNLGKSHYFSHKKSQEHFAYMPIVKPEEAMQRTKNWWLNQKK